jgi:hypothetical protein
MSKSLRYIPVVIMFILFISCNKKNGNTMKTENENIEMENFDTFYNKFHSDSLFQMARIKFPLEGQNIDGFKKTKWVKANWIMLKTKIYDVDTTKFITNYKKSKTDFIAQCHTEDSGFSSEYRFKIIKNKWHLVYAADKNL